MARSHHRHGLLGLLAIALPLLATSRPPQATPDLLIVGNDYSFVIPATVRPGLTTVSFENRGKQLHEMHLVRLKPGITFDSVFKVGPGTSRRALLEFGSGGILFAEPGQRAAGQLLMNFEAGRNYMVRCTLQDAPDKPEHVALGMFGGFKVR